MHPECEGMIYEAWNYETPMGSPMYRLFEKIKKSRMPLVEWSRQMGNLKTKLKEKKKELETLTTMNSVEILL